MLAESLALFLRGGGLFFVLLFVNIVSSFPVGAGDPDGFLVDHAFGKFFSFIGIEIYEFLYFIQVPKTSRESSAEWPDSKT